MFNANYGVFKFYEILSILGKSSKKIEIELF